MKFPLNWLKEFVTFKQAPEKVAEILMLGGFEVEKIQTAGTGLEQIVVGQIKTIVNHAEADRLSICKIDIGRKPMLTIVCGAKNIKPEQRVPVALIGAALPSGATIERRRIRGVDSEGMLCSEQDLDLGDDHSGIMILPATLRLGRPLGVAIGLTDTVLDITVTPNRADCYSVRGLAREFAGLTGQKFSEPIRPVAEHKRFIARQLLTVQVRDKELCPKYTARVVKNVKVRPSPLWLQSRLRLAGIQPINNVVDITNYVMLEMGQPLHAFDLAQVKGKRIIVRRSGRNSVFKTLDGVDRRVESSMLMIADAKAPIAIAGVMGGIDSEIRRTTRDIVLESAIFKSSSIRATRQRLGLATEASTRFEKGIWWDLPEQAVNRAAQLMHELAAGEIARGIISVAGKAGHSTSVIKINLGYPSRLIGKEYSTAEVVTALKKLYFGVVPVGKGDLKVTVPPWRMDVHSTADLVEEVGRSVGWSEVEPTPLYAALRPVSLPPEKYWERRVKETLVSGGFTEVLSYSFYGEGLAQLFSLPLEKHYWVKNPLNPEQALMRTSLLPQLFEVVMRNYQAQPTVKIFELGRVFWKENRALPNEHQTLVGLVYARQGGTREKIMAALMTLCEQLHIATETIQLFPAGGLWRQGGISIKNKVIGEYGQIHLSQEKLRQPPSYFEIDFFKLISFARQAASYTMPSPHPSIERDMTFVVQRAADISYFDIATAIRGSSNLVNDVRPIGLYPHSAETMNATVQVIYQAADRTLKREEVDTIEQKIIETLRRTLKAEIKK